MCAPGNETLAKSKPVSWKTIDDALLRVNDVAVKDWSVYQAGKKRDPLLLQIGNRFLLIEIHEQQLFELEASKIERKPEELRFDPSDRPANPLATSDWMESDIGAGLPEISAKIDSEGRVLDFATRCTQSTLGQTSCAGRRRAAPALSD